MGCNKYKIKCKKKQKGALILVIIGSLISFATDSLGGASMVGRVHVGLPKEFLIDFTIVKDNIASYMIDSFLIATG